MDAPGLGAQVQPHDVRYDLRGARIAGGDGPLETELKIPEREQKPEGMMTKVEVKGRRLFRGQLAAL